MTVAILYKLRNNLMENFKSYLLKYILIFSSRSDPGPATVPGSDWRKYLAKQPPKFTNVMETSSLTTFNKKMGLTYGKPKPGRQGRPTEKKPFNNKPAKKPFRPTKSKFVRKSNEKNVDINQGCY